MSIGSMRERAVRRSQSRYTGIANVESQVRRVGRKERHAPPRVRELSNVLALLLPQLGIALHTIGILPIVAAALAEWRKTVERELFGRNLPADRAWPWDIREAAVQARAAQLSETSALARLLNFRYRFAGYSLEKHVNFLYTVLTACPGAVQVLTVEKRLCGLVVVVPVTPGFYSRFCAGQVVDLDLSAGDIARRGSRFVFVQSVSFRSAAFSPDQFVDAMLCVRDRVRAATGKRLRRATIFAESSTWIEAETCAMCGMVSSERSTRSVDGFSVMELNVDRALQGLVNANAQRTARALLGIGGADGDFSK